MKPLVLIPLLLGHFTLFAQNEISVPSEIEEVTVFSQGAQVKRSAKPSIPKGDVTLVFKDVSPNLDEKSIQFNSNGNYSILAVNFQVYFEDNEEETKNRVVALNEKLRSIDNELESKEQLIAVHYNEEQVLLSNTDFGSAEGIDVVELEKGVEFVRSRLTQIRQNKQRLNNEMEDLYIQKQKVTNELQEIRLKNAKRKGKVIIKLSSEKAQNLKAQLSYVVSNAGWVPYYDLKVEDIDQPLEIIYKAKVNQSTGEDWKKVKLSLSTGDPYQEGFLPQLNPWFLNFTRPSYQRPVSSSAPRQKGISGTLSGTVLSRKTGEIIPNANIVAYTDQGEIVAGTTSGVDGKFSLSLDYPAHRFEVSFIGYTTHTEYLERTDKFYTVLMNESSEHLNNVAISYDAPLIDKTKSSKVTTAEDIVNMAVRDVSSVPVQSAGVTNIRGARDEGTAYFIDGVKVRGAVNLPQAVISNGAPAQYGDVFKISQNQITLNYEVNIPYDIPSDGEEYKVLIKEYSVEADYEYRATPKLSKHAYLIANLTDWEKLNLRNGDAGLYYGGTYLGESHLYLDAANDTLQISLGKDENILVLRNTIKQEQKKGIFGKTEMVFHYRISVRNNKRSPIKLEITDQYPVSGNSQIDVSRGENSKARVDDESGLLSWEFTLEPQKEKKLDLTYEVEYPKGKFVNIR